MSFSHSVGANTSNDPVSSASGELRYIFDARQAFTIRQEVSKLYRVDIADEEWQAADTVLSYRLRQDTPWSDASVSAVLSGSLPTSSFSREQEVLSTPGLSIQVSQRLFNERLTVSGGPFYRHHINRFKSMRDDDGGRYLVRSRYGLDVGLQATVTRKISLGLATQWVERTYEQGPYGNVPGDHRYNFDVSAAYVLDKKSTVAVGYNQSDLAEQLGRVDVYLFDVDTSSYYAQLSYQVF
jgi:hypothetical protein